MCLFSKHDVTADPPFARIDLISCKNVLIYFAADLQKRVVPILHYALNPGGILWLGRSETIAGFGNLFKVDDRANKFYSKKTVATPVRLQFSTGRRFQEIQGGLKVARPVATLQDVQAEADRVAIRQYAPPGVMINDAADILQVNGRPAPYIELSQGLASLNLFKLAHPEIVSDLRYLVNRARKENRAAKKDNLILNKSGSRRVFGIRVVPLRVIPPSQDQYFSIFFEETQSPPSVGSKTKQPVKTLVKRQQSIEDPEHTTPDWIYQQELIEEYETTQEELVSSNEELQSTNEELQSTNEELETAKEELQSANEEMTTINDELQTRNSDMSLLSNDLANLLSSVDIPIVMVSPDAKIRRFTPRASQTLNLIPSDIGRPISDIKPAIQAPDLGDQVVDVMSTLSIKEFETQDKHGAWHRLQARPYRTSDNRLDGAVIALMDITDLKRSAAALQIAHDDAKTIVDTMPTAMLVIDSNRCVQLANQAFANMFEIEPSDIQGKSMFELDGGVWNISTLSTMLESVLVQGTPFRDLEIEQDFPRVGHKDMVLHATATRFIDNADAAEVTALFIIANGLEVLSVSSGQHALEIAGTFHPEIVLCDLTLPDMSGLDVLQAMRSQENGKDALLVIFSARGERELRLLKRTIDASAVDFFLPKPITQESLYMLLSQLHGSRQRA
jgi:two-component system CheB/CheR fusion protein